MKLPLLLCIAASLALGQRAAVRTTGQFEPDGNVTYSVYVAAGQEDLEQLTISAALPPGTRYLESVHKPLDGIYEGVKSDTVSWKMDRLERDSLVGPFTFRVKLDGTAAELPASIRAAVAYTRPVQEFVESLGGEGRLVPLAARGSITFDQRGTLDSAGRNNPVAVGETGIVIFVPEGAVSERVTLTFNRLNVAESKLPVTDPPTWWCSLYQMISEPQQVRYSRDISIAYPSRRGLTPGVETAMFGSEDGENWKQQSGTAVGVKSEQGRAIGFGGLGQNVSVVCFSQFGQTVCRVSSAGGFGFGGFGGFGYVEQDNLRGKVTGTTLGQQAIQQVTNPPSIIAILIGARP